MGPPIVFPNRTPESIRAISFSQAIRPPRPYPCWRRAKCSAMSASVISKPAGTPSTIPVRVGPCDSPAVKYLIMIEYE